MTTWSDLVQPIEDWWDDMETWFEERGVSPVIGVILMVSITVVLSSVMMFFVTTANVGGESVHAGVDLYATEGGDYAASVSAMGTAEKIELRCGDEVRTLEEDGDEAFIRGDCTTTSVVAITETGGEVVMQSYHTDNIPTVPGSMSHEEAPNDLSASECDEMMDGDGVDESPYEVQNDYHLQCMAENPDAAYQLVNHIDATNTDQWNDGDGFKPIENFSGSFSGETPDEDSTYAIQGLTVHTETTNNVGLFDTLSEDASVDMVTLRNVDITGDENVGGLAGSAEAGASITDVGVQGDVSGNQTIGGVVGEFYGDTLNSSYTNVHVSGGANAGGLAGEFHSGTADEALIVGPVDGNGNIGGIVGYMYGGEIKNAQAMREVTGYSHQIGGVVGVLDDGRMENVHSTANVVSTETGNQIGGFAGIVRSTVVDSSAAAEVEGVENVGGHTGQIESTANIEDSTASGSAIGDIRVGGFAGRTTGDITNSHATGHAAGDADKERVGGFVGYMHPGSTVKQSSATGEAHGGDHVGGFAGANHGHIEESYAHGDVFGDGASVGGFTGYVNPDGSVRNVYAQGDVEGIDRVGSFSGRNLGSIDSGYASGSVTGSTNVGGAVGVYDDEDATTTDLYYNITAADEDDEYATALTRDEMTGSDAADNMNFDWTNIWETVADDFPQLQNVEYSDD